MDRVIAEFSGDSKSVCPSGHAGKMLWPRARLSGYLVAMHFYYRTFARVALLPYIGGTVIHVVRLICDVPITDIPFAVDWFVVIIGGYAGLGLIVFRRKIPFNNSWDKTAYGLLVFHLNGSVILHSYILIVGNHDVLQIFPRWYSLLAVAYFVALGCYCLSLNRRLYFQ